MDDKRRTKACKGPGKVLDKAQQDRARMAVSMTADQFHELTHFKLDQLWPERSRRAWKEVTMTID